MAEQRRQMLPAQIAGCGVAGGGPGQGAIEVILAKLQMRLRRPQQIAGLECRRGGGGASPAKRSACIR